MLGECGLSVESWWTGRPTWYTSDVSDRESSWHASGVTLTLLRHITAQGYTVSVHRLSGSLLCPGSSVEMHAVRDGEPVRIARVTGGDEPDYVAACRLAELVGCELEG